MDAAVVDPAEVDCAVVVEISCAVVAALVLEVDAKEVADAVVEVELTEVVLASVVDATRRRKGLGGRRSTGKACHVPAVVVVVLTVRGTLVSNVGGTRGALHTFYHQRYANYAKHE